MDVDESNGDASSEVSVDRDDEEDEGRKRKKETETVIQMQGIVKNKSKIRKETEEAESLTNKSEIRFDFRELFRKLASNKKILESEIKESKEIDSELK